MKKLKTAFTHSELEAEHAISEGVEYHLVHSRAGL